MCGYNIVLFCVLTFLIHVPKGNSLKCGVCTSELQPDCRDASKVTKIEECNKNSVFVCRTIEYYLKRENTFHVARGCSEERDRSNNDACSKARLQFYAQVNKCQTCNTDFCNAHPGLGVNVNKASVKESFATPSPSPGGSAAVRSSFCFVIACLFITLYKNNYI